MWLCVQHMVYSSSGVPESGSNLEIRKENIFVCLSLTHSCSLSSGSIYSCQGGFWWGPKEEGLTWAHVDSTLTSGFQSAESWKIDFFHCRYIVHEFLLHHSKETKFVHFLWWCFLVLSCHQYIVRKLYIFQHLFIDWLIDRSPSICDCTVKYGCLHIIRKKTDLIGIRSSLCLLHSMW